MKHHLPPIEGFDSDPLTGGGRRYYVAEECALVAYWLPALDFPGAGPDGVIVYTFTKRGRAGTVSTALDVDGLRGILEAWRDTQPTPLGAPLPRYPRSDIRRVQVGRLQEAMERARHLVRVP